MTGPATRGTERGTRAPTRLTATLGAVGAVLVVLALGLVLRSIIARLLPGSGFGVDLNAFRFWASNLASQGLNGFYGRDFFHDYTPGYLYVLWVVGIVGQALGGVGDLIKIPPILADLAIGWLAWSMVRELGGRDRLALLAAAVAVLNPVSWFDSVVWGQADAFGVVFLMLGLRALWRDQPERAAIFAVIAAMIKPQLGILIPLLAFVTIRRALWPPAPEADTVAGADATGADSEDPGPDGVPGPAPSLVDRFRGWESRTGHPIRIVTTALVAIVTVWLLCLPFGLSVIEFVPQAPFFHSGLLEQILSTAGGYPYTTVNAYNPWAVVVGDLGYSLANSGLWICDGPWGQAICGSGSAVFGPIPAVYIGSGLMVAVVMVVSIVAARRPDRLTLLVGLAVLALAFYVVPTRVHERYAYPFFAIAIVLAAVAWRWRVAYLVLSVTVFLNMYAALTNPFYNNPKIADWLGIGTVIRGSEPIIAILALVNGLAFLWTFSQLRGRAHRRLTDELALASRGDPGADTAEAVTGTRSGWTDGTLTASGVAAPGRDTGAEPYRSQPAAGPAASGEVAMAGAAAVALPTWTPRPSFDDIGVVGWFRSRLNDPPIRPDRSALLRHEGGGRLDRVDAFLLILLFLATLGLRTFRLAEPYQMHFDEVYHARTATEFLQYWRYGLSHSIYEWTHPHLAKYVMAGGIVLWGGDAVQSTSELHVPVKATAIEPRRIEASAPNDTAGQHLFVATGSQIQVYDLVTRDLITTVDAPHSSALAVDDNDHLLVIGGDDGSISTLDLTTLTGTTTAVAPPEIVPVATVDHPIEHLLVTDDGSTVIAASSTRLTSVALDTGSVNGSLDGTAIADLAPGGSGTTLVATGGEVTNPSAVASKLADILSTDASYYESKLASASPGTTVVLGDPGTGDTRTKIDAAIADGSLPGVRVDNVERVAVAMSTGVAFIDPTNATVVNRVPLDGGAHGLALVTGIDDNKLWVTTGTAAKPSYNVIVVGGTSANNPVSTGSNAMPGLGSQVIYDAASQMVHILGLAPGAGPNGPWTVYVVEPHGDAGSTTFGAVYADARLPDGFSPAAWSADFNPDYPSEDRQQSLVFNDTGTTASIDAGSHAFAWRLPGVIAGAITAVLLYLLTRILFRRRLIAGLVGLFVLVDGMFFVQSRIGMNDVYVGLFIVAAYVVFAALWTGWWRGRAAFWLGIPIVGLLLGLALASKWVAAYAIGAVVLLILVRSALGRVLAILGMIGLTSVLGYMAISVPAAAGSTDPGFGNLTFLLIMVALTLLGVAIAVLHPVAWTDDEWRIAIAAPLAASAFVFFGALATGRMDAHITLGKTALTPLTIALLFAFVAVFAAVAFWLGGRWGFGPFATPPGPDDPANLLEPPAPPAEGWLRPGWLAGLPVVWAAAFLIVAPVVVYVIVYIPWAFVTNPQNQIIPGWPPGHTGQTLLDLTAQMYAYHNNLASAHPASSPWWAWPENLKPVWFYQDSLAAGTSAAIYDAGSLVIWWIGIPAIAFVSWMAFRRRSLALALIAVGFAAQWIPWARIDRAAFQYHYYTALPFVVMALAYFMAELWHGASRHTWALARIAAGIAIVAPALLWILDWPLCAFVGVDSVNPNSAACPAVIPQFVLTVRAAALTLIAGAGLLIIVLRFLAFEPGDDADPDVESSRMTSALRSLVVAGGVVAIGLFVASFLPDTPIITLTNIPVEPIALVIAVPLGWLGLQIFASRDARRFVIGYVVAAVGWFAILYPNISALPLPNAVVAAYQGILPTYLYAFQFPVSTVTRGADTPVFTPMLALLTVALIVTCLVIAYSTSLWRLALAEARGRPNRSSSSASSDIDGLARSGGA